MTVSRGILFSMINVSDNICEGIKTHFMLIYYFFLKSCRLGYTIAKSGTNASESEMTHVLRNIRVI